MDNDIIFIGETSGRRDNLRPRKRINYFPQNPEELNKSARFQEPSNSKKKLSGSIAKNSQTISQATQTTSITTKMEAKSTQTESQEDKLLCTICFENKIRSCFYPCGHVMCEICISSLNNRFCPFCNTWIKRKVKLFF